MLSLLFEAGALQCALPCAQIEEVLPLSLLEPVPGGADAFAGLLSFRGQMLPVLDAGLLLAGAPSPRKLSTRLVVLSAERWFGLICAGAHDVQVLTALPQGSLEFSSHPLVARVMLLGDRPVHCLAVDRLAVRLARRAGEEDREGARTTA